MSHSRKCNMNIFSVLLIFVYQIISCEAIGEVIWAMNCGGPSHTDIHGIRYQKDNSRSGVASDYGKSLIIQRVVPQDQILYQTERYDSQNFAYDIPISKDGDYVLVLKFSEVWFTQPNQKVFDVAINGIQAIENLDIFGKVGRGVAHDEVVAFQVKSGMIRVSGTSAPIDGNKISVEFVKGDHDNPKINAIYVMRGLLEDVPQLPKLPDMNEQRAQLPEEEEEEEELEDDTLKREKRRRPSSGPKVQDPYAADDTGSMMLPVVIAIGAFIPLLFCLCRL